eukprot:166564-Pyramimonas_sp.AAC.1
MADVFLALSVYCCVSLVSAFGIIFELQGLSIGGVLSRVALSVLLCSQEFRAKHDHTRFGREGFPPLQLHNHAMFNYVGMLTTS